MLCFTTLEKYSFLKIDKSYEVPLKMLEEVVDEKGRALMAWARRRGGEGELRQYVRRCDRLRCLGEWTLNEEEDSDDVLMFESRA